MSAKQPSIAYSVTIRAEYPNHVGMLSKITAAIGRAGGDIGAMVIANSGRDLMLRDITVNAKDSIHASKIVEHVKATKEVKIVSVSDEVFSKHQGGKIEVRSKNPIETQNDMSLVYSPGVARVSSAIYKNPDSVWSLTSKGNSVAIVTDGSAVLGLGDIGPAAALPVMEGKAQLFKELGDVDAWPIAINTKDPDEIVNTVKQIATGFGGINLEDISAPRCFYIEERLKAELDIPVFHDDQHGTAVVVIAALLNAIKIVDKSLNELKVVVTGVGAAGLATTNLMLTSGVKNILGFDRQGILHRERDYGDNDAKRWFAESTNPDNLKGGIDEAMNGADLFIGLSAPGVITLDHVKLMNRDPIVFAMSNPDPEIWPEEVSEHVRVMATGRSDYPNQVNNALCFPGLFRGVLDTRSSEINDAMKLAAARAIADGVPRERLSEEYIMPSLFDKSVVVRIAEAVSDAAKSSGISRVQY